MAIFHSYVESPEGKWFNHYIILGTLWGFKYQRHWDVIWQMMVDRFWNVGNDSTYQFTFIPGIGDLDKPQYNRATSQPVPWDGKPGYFGSDPWGHGVFFYIRKLEASARLRLRMISHFVTRKFEPWQPYPNSRWKWNSEHLGWTPL